MAEQSQVSGIPTIEPNTLYVGQGVCIKGDVMVPGILVVDGLIEGNVTGRAVWISESGSIKGKIRRHRGRDLRHGFGNDRSQQLMVVRSTGHVLGDIHYGDLQLAKGAVLSGTLSCVSDEQAPVVEFGSHRVGSPEDRAPGRSGAAAGTQWVGCRYRSGRHIAAGGLSRRELRAQSSRFELHVRAFVPLDGWARRLLPSFA